MSALVLYLDFPGSLVIALIILPGHIDQLVQGHNSAVYHTEVKCQTSENEK